MTRRQEAPCHCRCICHDNSWPVRSDGDLPPHGDLICAKTTRAGRCGKCRRDCNAPARP